MHLYIKVFTSIILFHSFSFGQSTDSLGALEAADSLLTTALEVDPENNQIKLLKARCSC